VPVTEWHAQWAWLGTDDAVESGVLIGVDGDRIASIATDIEQPPPDAHRLAGLVMPGLANAHSHCFHRALRGRTNGAGGTFWTWREQMYGVAARLNPETYNALATATFAEMALSGITGVGEFHYLHHAAGGRPYGDRNAMGDALMAAANEIGIRMTLLDTCYLAGGFGVPPDVVQQRFSDGDAHRWAERVSDLRTSDTIRQGAAIHSVRAVPADQMTVVAQWAGDHQTPLHVHLSEQRAENGACAIACGCTPAQLLDDAGALGDRTTAIHGTHCAPADVSLLGARGSGLCRCPTTERDLGDGIGPARDAAKAGVRLSVGSDGNSVIDLFEEARSMELDERLRVEARGIWTPAALLRAATTGGQSSLGWDQAGQLTVGSLADFIAIDLDAPRIAGADPAHLLEAVAFGATASEVRDVVVGGRIIVSNRHHRTVEDVPDALRRAIAAVTA
jgi:formiminoglutamate deiminase